MKWQRNKYYLLKEVNEETLMVGSALLESYSLTHACLAPLGGKLLDKLEFGFFSPGTEIIHEHELGKDMFLLCKGIMDVLVNGQIVVQMEAPNLMGEKVIVDPQSKRAATIRVSEGQTAILIKIPMGTFIRNFDDDHLDIDFKQELDIFTSVFYEIQKRLIDYNYLQKQLLEEVNTTQKLINSRIMAQNIEKGQDMEWDDSLWEFILKYLNEKHHFPWHENAPKTVLNLKNELSMFLDSQFPRIRFKGTDSEYSDKKNKIWKNWLLNLSSVIIRELPQDKQLFKTPDVELFNPENYRTRVINTLNSMEGNFSKKSIPAANKHSCKWYFSKGTQNFEFLLLNYIKGFEKSFEMNQERKTPARIAQKLALVAAECENQFNSSVAQLQKFLEKAKGKVFVLSDKQKAAEKSENEFQNHANILLKGIIRFKRLSRIPMHQRKRKIITSSAEMPTLTNLLFSCENEIQRREIQHAFDELSKIVKLNNKQLPNQLLQNNLHFAEALFVGDEIPANELVHNYWIPLQKMVLMWGKKKVGFIAPGCIVGGEKWNDSSSEEKKDDKKDDSDNKKSASHFRGVFLGEKEKLQMAGYLQSQFYLRNQIPKPALFIILPQKSLPWTLKRSPDIEKFKKEFLPVIQWIIDEYLEHLVWWVDQRDILLKNQAEMKQISKLDAKIQELEIDKTILEREKYSKVCQLLKTRFNLIFDPDKELTTAQLLRKIYHNQISQINKEHPEIPLEERGNKAYTLWRFILSEIISLLEPPTATADEEEEQPGSVFEKIFAELKTLDKKLLSGKNTYNTLLEDPPKIDMKNIFFEKTLYSTLNMLEFFEEFQKILTSSLHNLAKECYELRMQLTKFSDNSRNFEMEEVKMEFINKHLEHFISLLNK